MRIVLAGDLDSPRGGALLAAAHSVFSPNKVLLGTEGAVEGFAGSLRVSGPPKAFLCSGSECKKPTSDPEALRRMIEESAGG
jgi:uncharacterized protein YyaL (SSP411 family)